MALMQLLLQLLVWGDLLVLLGGILLLLGGLQGLDLGECG
jgi:hypothetical protein